MSLIWKIALLTIVVSAVLASKKYRDQGIFNPIEDLPDTPRYVKTDLDDDFMETLFMGQVTCHGKEMEGVRPFLQSPLYLDEIQVITTTKEHGFYRLFTVPAFKDARTARITIRHQCEFENIPHVKDCLIPMYWTEVSLPLNTGRMSITYNFELDKMERYSRASCLV